MDKKKKEAIVRTEEFLRNLCRDIPNVPDEVRNKARNLLKDYPSAHYMDKQQ